MEHLSNEIIETKIGVMDVRKSYSTTEQVVMTC